MHSLRSQIGLNSLNFFLAAVQTGFGPFFSVYLTERGWSQVDIGIALSIGTAAVLILQLPGGALVDAIHQKRFANGLGLLLLGLSVALLLAKPTTGPVWTAQIVHALASCILTPAVAALTLALCGHDAFSERLGINARYASLGSAIAAGLLGAIASYFSEHAVFVAVAVMVIPALLTVPLFRNSDRVIETDHPSLLHPRERRQRRQQPWHIFKEPALHIFAVCAVLFSVSNAAMLPLALNELAKRTGESGFVVSASIMVPQAIVALCSPWAGRMAQQIGRRPVLLIGFAALPLRAILFVGSPDAIPLVVIETLDGISGTVFGLMVPLIAADVTQRSGFLNLAISSIGLAVGFGATISTTLAGWLADQLGAPMAFFSLAVIGLSALIAVWSWMPETRPSKPLTDATATAAA